ncbi:MAG TPA: hypothetical protein VEL74_09610 [Thermoanaerobaculia bacterium]|nr:hypothetical protein [Thermoanaerobaculia bacterium]
MSHPLSKLALASLLILPLGTVGCSKSQSPTEPAVDLESAVVSAESNTASVTEESRGRGRGGDDEAGDDRGRRRGRGSDDAAGDDRGRRGRRGRGGDDATTNNGGGRRGGRNGGNGGNGEQRPRTGQEFEARVVSVDVGGGSLTLAGGATVRVNGQTQWSGRGDLLSLTEIAGSVRSGDPTRVEGRGTRQGDGSILALTLKAEVDN